MEWDTPPGRALEARRQAANYSFLESFDSAGEAALVEPFAVLFAYASGAGGNHLALMEGLLRLETCAATLDAAIPMLWQRSASTALTVAVDTDKQRLDRLFGLDGRAGLLGLLKTYRKTAASELPAMSSVEQAAFLETLLAFADGLLDAGWWSSRMAVLPLYLQALGLVVLVQGWIGGLPGPREEAAIARHQTFLIAEARSLPAEAADILLAAATALRG